MEELKEYYPEVLPNEVLTLADALSRIRNSTGQKFIDVYKRQDLNESLQEFSILDSIKNAFSVDGKTYIAAARYAIPSIWGTADDMRCV